MRKVFFLLFVSLFQQSLSAQTPVPSQKEIRSQMKGAADELKKQVLEMENQIAEAKKNKEDAEAIKEMEDQLAVLRKQVAMIEGLNKTVSGISEKTFQQAGEEEATVPQKDHARINMVPKKTLTEAQLVLLIKNVHTQVERMIPAVEKEEALKIYTETKEEYKSVIVVANAASGCWMVGHWEKALYLMGRACMDDITETDNLNNYASFLISTGAEQAAIPILEYLNELYPENSTILNNMGQAWYGLGNLDNAKKRLAETILFYPNHSMANATLSNVARSEGDNQKAIDFLKASLKESYDPGKEAELAKLGYNISFDDMPEFNFPMKKDPINLLPFFDLMPEKFPSYIGDDATVDAVNDFVGGTRKLSQELDDENQLLKEKISKRNWKLAENEQYTREFLGLYHNSPAYKLAKRSIQLYDTEVSGSISPLPFQLLFPFHIPLPPKKKIINPIQLKEAMDSVWLNEVEIPIARLPYELPKLPENATCQQNINWTNQFYTKRGAIENRGMMKIKAMYRNNAARFDKWMQLHIYAFMDEKDFDGRASRLISDIDHTISRRLLENTIYKNFVDYGLKLVIQREYLKDFCQSGWRPRDYPDPKDLPRLVKHDLPCEFIRTLKTPLVWYSAQCNILEQDPNSKMKDRKSPVPKGQVHKGPSRKSSSNKGPQGNLPKGPYGDYFIFDLGTANQKAGPLTPEKKDLSQFSIEYDKWGNLTGLNFQLNEEGTAFADPDLENDDIESRWSWNAMASPKKGFLNKLVIK